MNHVVALLVTIAVPVAVVVAAGLWQRASAFVQELRALDVEGIHFER